MTDSPLADTKTSARSLDRRISVAPMMAWTDRFCRFLLRQISQHTLLYTEMVTTAALLHGNRDYLLRFDPGEHPVALQLGGNDPQALAQCARMGEDAGYDEINLNCGCPSDRVQSGQFGASLMKSPRTVADGIAAMRASVRLPVTVKTRIGVDDRDSYSHLMDFVGTVAAAGCDTFIIHARKAWLQGLSPKQNREVPPLQYDRVYQLKQDFPALQIILNGGVNSLDEAAHHLTRVDGVMLGRAAYHNPYLLADVDRRFYAKARSIPSREQILERYARFVENQLAEGARLSHMSRHAIGLFQGQPGGRRFRRHISEHACRPGAGSEVLYAAVAAMHQTAEACQ